MTVVVEQVATVSDRLSKDELERRRAILDQIASLPDENPGDTFSGRDHDKVLYGPPYGA